MDICRLMMIFILVPNGMCCYIIEYVEPCQQHSESDAYQTIRNLVYDSSQSLFYNDKKNQNIWYESMIFQLFLLLSCTPHTQTDSTMLICNYYFIYGAILFETIFPQILIFL